MARRPNGYWQEFANLEAVLRPIADELYRLPTKTEIRERGLTGVDHGISLHGGHDLVAARLGIESDWSDAANAAKAILSIQNAIGHFPTANEIRERMHGKLYDAIRRHHGGLSAFRLVCGAEQPAKPYGYWQEYERVRLAVEDWIREHGTFPSTRRLVKADQSGLHTAIMRHHGGYRALRKKMGRERPTDRVQNGFWENKENVLSVLREVCESQGGFPSNASLAELGHASLTQAVYRVHGGMAAIKKELGFVPRNRPKGTLDDFAQFARELEAAIATIGHFPTQAELGAIRASSLAAAMKRHGGIGVVREKMGYGSGRHRGGHWQDFENIKVALCQIICRIGDFPSSEQLRKERNGLVNAIMRHHGGLIAVRDRLGYGPVTDETLASHADALAQIVPALGANPTVLWSRMKRSWTTRDLDAAVAAHATTGSLEAFERLLSE